jgi:hypothetical protein
LQLPNAPSVYASLTPAQPGSDIETFNLDFGGI